MNKTTTVKDWSIEAITKSKRLNVPTVKEFLIKNCDCDPKKVENQDYIKALESQELSDFFMKRFKKELKIEKGINLSQITELERKEILNNIEENYSTSFVEYKDLYAIYIKKLFLMHASDILRKKILLEEENEKNKVNKNPDEYSTYSRGFITKTKKLENNTTPVIAIIK